MARRERKDPRRRTLWIDKEQLFQLAAEDLPPNVRVAMNADSPSENATRLHIIVEWDGDFPPIRLRKVGAAIAHTAGLRLLDVAQGHALTRLGVRDTPFTVPAPGRRPEKMEVFGTWVRLAEDGDLSLGMWFHYDWKDEIRRIFSAVVEKRSPDFTRPFSSWWPEKRMWWFGNREIYPEFIGQLRLRGLNVEWIAREGFPPPPAVQKVTEQL